MEGRPLAESELVERAKQGDQGACGHLVHPYQGIAFRTAYLVTDDAAEAEDAAQEGFVKAFYALGGFRAGAPLRPWLLRIVGNAARNRRRSAGRRAQLALAAGANEGAGPARASFPAWPLAAALALLVAAAGFALLVARRGGRPLSAS